MTYDEKPMFLLQARGISKVFKISRQSIEVLNGVDFELEEKETVAIVGASGIGKSTLLHILGTLDRPDKGQLLFKNQDVFRFDEERLANFRNQSIGFVFQFHHLLADFTALENVMMPALVGGMEGEKASEIAGNLLTRVGLKDRLNHKPGELSGGEQQRVAIARSLCLNPSVLMADEPTGNLDKKTSMRLHDLLMELNEELNIAMVIVTHNMDLASCAKRKLTIIDGKLAQTN